MISIKLVGISYLKWLISKSIKIAVSDQNKWKAIRMLDDKIKEHYRIVLKQRIAIY